MVIISSTNLKVVISSVVVLLSITTFLKYQHNHELKELEEKYTNMIEVERGKYQDIIEESHREVDTIIASLKSEYEERLSLYIKELEEQRVEEARRAEEELIRNKTISMIVELNPSVTPERATQLHDLAVKYGDMYDIDPVMVLAIMWVESRFNHKAVSSHNAVGLMQILPSTAKPYGVSRQDLFNIETNIATGTKYFSDIRKQLNNDTRLAIIAYNQGIGNVKSGKYRTWYYDKVNKSYAMMRYKIGQ